MKSIGPRATSCPERRVITIGTKAQEWEQRSLQEHSTLYTFPDVGQCFCAVMVWRNETAQWSSPMEKEKQRWVCMQNSVP